MQISAKDVKALREKSGAGIMDCKEALTATNGDVAKAVAWLREKGLKTYEAKASRAASEGVVTSYIHAGGKIGVLVEVNCETDFVARTDMFQELVREIAMQIAAANPRYLVREDVPAGDLDKEKEILKAQAVKEGKPAHIAEKIVEGRLRKFYEEQCLLEQPYIRDEGRNMETVLKDSVAKLGERIVVRRFARYVLGQESTVAETNTATNESGDAES